VSRPRPVRPRRGARGLAAQYAADPSAAVLGILRESGAAVTAADIKQTLEAAGVTGLDKRTWDRLQKRLRVHDNVAVEPGHRYRWVADPVVPAPDEAFEQIAHAVMSRTKPSFVEAIRKALADAPGTSDIDAQQRQAVLDGVRALAELASEVEELTVNQASDRALIHRIRGRVKLSGLEPIERAGETVPFDRKRHELIGPSIAEGRPVIVLRPGYAWKGPGEDVLVARAVVQE
jgi:DNA-binding cell septation regulator SpoVG